MRTQERLEVDARWTWKPHRVAYEIIKALRGRDAGAVVEVITKDDQGLLNDLGAWCRATGHELLSVHPGEGWARVLIRTGEPVRSARTMKVIMSTASVEHAVYPLDKALAGAVLGMDVNVVFEGAAVRLLKRGYRPKLSGLAGGVFTAMVERVMKKEIGSRHHLGRPARAFRHPDLVQGAVRQALAAGPKGRGKGRPRARGSRKWHCPPRFRPGSMASTAAGG